MAVPPKASTTEEENKQNSPESSQQPSTTKSNNEPEKNESAITSSMPPKPISSEETTTSLKTMKKNEQFETSVNTNTNPRKSGCPQNLPNKSFGTMTCSTEKPGLVDVPQQPSTTKSTEPEKSESLFTSSSPPKPISSEETNMNEQFQTLASTNTCPRKSRKNYKLASFGLVLCDSAANRNSSGARPTDHVIKMNEEMLQTPDALPPKSEFPNERMASNEQLVTPGNIDYETSWPKVGEIKPDKKRGARYPSSSGAKATDNKNLQTVNALPEKVNSSNATKILTPTTKSTEQLVTVVDTSDHEKSGCTTNLSTQIDGTESYLPSSATKLTSSSTTPAQKMKKNEEMVQIVDATMISTRMTNTEQLVTVVNTSDPTKSGSTTNLSQIGGSRVDLPSSAINKTSCPETTADHDTNVDALPPKSDFSDKKMASNEQSVTDGNSDYNIGWPKVGKIEPGKKRGGHYHSSSSAKNCKNLQTVNALPEKVDSFNATRILTPTTKSTEKLETVVETSDHGKSGCTTNLPLQMDGTKSDLLSSAIKQASSSTTTDFEMKNKEMVQTVDATMTSTQTMNNEQLETVVDVSDHIKSSCTTNLSQIGGTRIDLPSAINQTSCPETTTDHDTKMKEEMVQTVDALPEKDGTSNTTMTSIQPTNTEQSLTDWVPQMDRTEIVLPSSATNQNSSSATTAEQEMARTGAHILNVLYGDWLGQR